MRYLVSNLPGTQKTEAAAYNWLHGHVPAKIKTFLSAYNQMPKGREHELQDLQRHI